MYCDIVRMLGFDIFTYLSYVGDMYLESGVSYQTLLVDVFFIQYVYNY